MEDYTTQIVADEFGTGFSGAMLIFYLIYMLVMMGISIASYVLQSVSFYSIAKRRGIKKPWLSWLPVGNMWILGCISDQFQYVVKGKVKNKRKAMLVLNIIMWAVYIAFFAVYFVFLFQILDGAFSGDMADSVVFEMLGTVMGILALALVMAGVAIAILVIQYMALYDLYTSCDPGNNVAFLLISIFVSVAQPVLLFICRNKDRGMPPRKQEPACIPEEPQWQPSEPPVEPWGNDPEE